MIVRNTSHHFLSAKSGAGCHYGLIISDMGTIIIGQFFLLNHVYLLTPLMIHII
ncbi:MAG: hypothetical protein LJE66_02710 [Desulfobacterales bacterium]|jgi:hypothetical protein|nr:hypothetical protein [Desulfobacterales bacterium]